MKRYPHGMQNRMLFDERVEAIEAFERLLVDHGRVPKRRWLPHRVLMPALRVLGAVVLALNVAVLVLLVNFIVFNRLLHASF